MNLSISVPFHGNTLYLVEHNGEAYTPMKPIVEGMGMDWASQFTKLKQRFAKGIVEIAIPSEGGIQKMTCLLLRKLAGWLYSISPNKVRADLRETVVRYQAECDDVLWSYWAKGEAINPRKSTSDTRTPLRQAVSALVSKRGLMYPEAYALIHQRFAVGHLDELTDEQIPHAVEYVHRLTIEGEWLPREVPKAAVTLSDGEVFNLAGLLRMLPALRDVQKKAEAVLRAAQSPLAADMYDAWHEPTLHCGLLASLRERCEAVKQRTTLLT